MLKEKLICENGENKRYKWYKTNFLDDIDDGVQVLFDKKRACYTDNGYLSFEFTCRGLNIADYAKLIDSLGLNYGIYYSKKDNELIMHPNRKRNDNLALFLQIMLQCFAYLKFLSQPNFRQKKEV